MNQLTNIEDTIVAIASAHDVGGHRGIVRISGPRTKENVQQYFHPNIAESDWTEQKYAKRIAGSVELDDFGEIPCDLFLWPNDRSYTRQPTAELHTYGSLPILQSLVTRACDSGARLAMPGEFTMRSFLSGRIDLAQAEAVLGVIDAASDREIHVALTQLSGGLSRPLTELRDNLLNLVADLEAGLDFVDEDIEFVSTDQVVNRLQKANALIESTLRQIGERDSGGQLPRVVLRGEPNVGKSSLWNAMVHQGQALVAAAAGTTRDYLVGEVRHEHGSFQLIDTAGKEDSTNAIQRAMQETGESQVRSANLILLCIDCSRALTEWEHSQLSNRDGRTIAVATKCDLLPVQTPAILDWADLQTRHNDATSRQLLVETCVQRFQKSSPESGVVSNTAARCRESLRNTGEAIERAHQLTLASAGEELTVSELRTALDQLGLVVGAIYNDDILDRVFSRFCIGK